MKIAYLYIIFFISAAILIVNRYTHLYINNSIVHFIVLFGAALSFVLIVGRQFNRLKSRQSVILTFLAVGLVCFVRAYFMWGGDWKTQTVIFRNKKNPDDTVEMQLRGDRFAFGYKKRVVERLAIIPYFDWVTDIDTSAAELSGFERVDEHVNELGLHNYE